MEEPGTTGVLLQPHFAELEGDQRKAQEFFLSFADQLEALTQAGAEFTVAAMRRLREQGMLDARESLGRVYQPVCLAVSILCDLAVQGWQLRCTQEGVRIQRPDPHADRETERDRVRRALLVVREEQLSEPAVRAFVKSMETRRLGPRGWHSIFSLMRDGAELAATLRQATGVESPNKRHELLEQAIQPYLQFVAEDARCERTGLRLSDIWRYFRYTWLTPARSTPGRNMMILVRDAAVEPHPVIGIAALSSSIVQQSERDRWIGWDRETVLQALRQEPSDETASWLLRSLDELIDGISVEDFLRQGVVTAEELRRPSDEFLARLRAVGAEEREKHRIKVRRLDYKQLQASEDWTALVRTHLFQSKRALGLADLLEIRREFADAGLTEGTSSRLSAALNVSRFRHAVGRLVRYIKAAHVGINMMDISVAGAVAPYNVLLGGKLVSLLLASPEVTAAYSRRYGSTPSKIASSMKGEPVVRTPYLVLLCTTGLFAGGSSQYNRVRMPTSVTGGQEGEIRYTQLDQVTSYGTFHFSQATMREMGIYAAQWHNGSDVHGIFGEGVNPKMRKIRQELGRLGFPEDELLRHGSSRALYVVPLARNFREVLIGKTDEPEYFLSTEEPEGATAEMIAFWRRRWLSERIEHPGVLEGVAKHTLTYPMLHGAAVELPFSEDADDNGGDEQLDLDELFLGTDMADEDAEP